MKDLLTVSNLIFILGGLGITLKLWLKFRPQDRDELLLTAQGIDVADKIIDTLLETFEDNVALQTVDDIVNVLQKQFEKAGLKVDKKEIEKKVKEKVKDTEGFTMNYDPETQTTKLEYNDKF